MNRPLRRLTVVHLALSIAFAAPAAVHAGDSPFPATARWGSEPASKAASVSGQADASAFPPTERWQAPASPEPDVSPEFGVSIKDVEFAWHVKRTATPMTAAYVPGYWPDLSGVYRGGVSRSYSTHAMAKSCESARGSNASFGAAPPIFLPIILPIALVAVAASAINKDLCESAGTR